MFLVCVPPGCNSVLGNSNSSSGSGTSSVARAWLACLRICVATNSYTTTLLLYYTTSLLLLLLDTTNTITYSTTSTTTTTTTTTTTLTGNRTNYSYYSNKFITRKGGNEGWRPLDDAKEDSGQSSMARADAHYP